MTRQLTKAMTAALAVSLGALVVTGCGSTTSNGSPAAAGTGSASATGGGPGGAPTTGSTTGASGGSSLPSSSTGVVTPVASGGCVNLPATAAAKAGAVAAYQKVQPGMPYLVTRPGRFYYGQCQGTYYAASQFTVPAGVTPPLSEQVALQDDGAAMKYFRRNGDGSWTLIASDGFPAAPGGCAAIPRIPKALAALWADCLSH
jgi:hypothetical protein